MFEKKATPARVLVAEPESKVREAVIASLQGEGFDVEDSGAGPDLLDKLSSGGYEVVVSGLNFPGPQGLDILERIKETAPESEVILINGHGGPDMAMEAIDRKAFDYMDRPVDPTRLFISVKRAAEKSRMQSTMRGYVEKIGEISHIDGLTGLYKHRYLIDRIESETKRVRRFGWPLSCLMIDIDHFSRINETYGVEAGDAVLKELADLLRGTIREIDVIGRYGGEEFMIVLPNTSIEETSGLAHRILNLVAKHPFRHNGHSMRLTVSIGGAPYFFDRSMSGEDVVRWADRALARSKRSGRNTVSLYSGTDYEVLEGLLEKNIKDIDEIKESLDGLLIRMRRSFLDQIRSFVEGMEYRIGFRARHALAMTESAVEVARSLGLAEGMIEKIRYAGMLHDLGMIGVGPEVINKAGPLSDAEYALVKEHSAIGSYIARSIKFLEEEIVIIRHHHEAYDGSGYPDGLKAEEIPIASRVLTVADAFEAMTSDRPFRGARSQKEALEEIAAGAGTKFDPMIARTLITLKREEAWGQRQA